MNVCELERLERVRYKKQSDTLLVTVAVSCFLEPLVAAARQLTHPTSSHQLQLFL